MCWGVRLSLIINSLVSHFWKTCEPTRWFQNKNIFAPVCTNSYQDSCQVAQGNELHLVVRSMHSRILRAKNRCCSKFLLHSFELHVRPQHWSLTLQCAAFMMIGSCLKAENGFEEQHQWPLGNQTKLTKSSSAHICLVRKFLEWGVNRLAL